MGVAPAADAFEDLSTIGARSIFAAPISSEGEFELEGLDARKTYTLSAAARGGVCASRPTGVRPGADPVEIGLLYLHGVAILLRGADGVPPRTSPAFFGRGPVVSGPGHKLLQPPPELMALGIAGLERGEGTRDRWQYLTTSESIVPAVGPLEYRVLVPGYQPKEEIVFARPVIQELHEVAVLLEAKGDRWSDVDVRLFGATHVLDLGLPDGELIGVVRLVAEGDEPWEERILECAVHGRALREREWIGALPAGTYVATFEAEDSYYQTEQKEWEVIPGPSRLEFEIGDAGTLLVDVREQDAAYDSRWIMRVDIEDGSHFYSTFDAGPYVVPFLRPGSYRLMDGRAPGRTCDLGIVRTFEIFPGELSVALVSCRRDE